MVFKQSLLGGHLSGCQNERSKEEGGLKEKKTQRSQGIKKQASNEKSSPWRRQVGLRTSKGKSEALLSARYNSFNPVDKVMLGFQLIISTSQSTERLADLPKCAATVFPGK